jgi:DNA helicase-2/ATP-dependent DNA helicase PcrA
VVEAFNRLSNLAVPAGQVLTEAEASGQSYFATWMDAARTTDTAVISLLNAIEPIVSDASAARSVIDQLISEFEKLTDDGELHNDLAEDISAWRELSRDISRHIGKSAPLDQFLQELQLRSKEPSPKPGTVALMTIHGAKGREFDTVYVVGLAEDVMPSFQSRQKGDNSPEMEEERRNCFGLNLYLSSSTRSRSPVIKARRYSPKVMSTGGQ